MAKDPAMLFYTSDFLTGVTSLTMKERGQYITLLCLQQQMGHLTLKEMRKAVGPLSEDVMKKFVQDDQGRYYNVRAEKEIQKRAAHCAKQKKNISSRWNNQGNTMVHTTVLPLENENENLNIPELDIAESNDTQERLDMVEDREFGGKKPNGQDQLGRVLDLYMDRVNATPSSGVVGDLKHFTELMGPDVVCHAIQAALDERKVSWSYIQAILRNYKAEGVRSLADVQRREDQFRKQQESKRGQKKRETGGAATNGADAGNHDPNECYGTWL